MNYQIQLYIGHVVAYVISHLIPSWIMKKKLYFKLWEKQGYHITPNHFYEPIPDLGALPPDIFSKASKMIGIDMRAKAQLALLLNFKEQFQAEYKYFPRTSTNNEFQYFTQNGAFELVDGEILYCMIRQFKPKKIFEIGSGNSTLLAAQAVLKNQSDGSNCELIAFEPYPNEKLQKGFSGLSKLERIPIQNVPLERFNELEENDILFIDSSHVVKLGSDVVYEILEILPRLKRGVIVHFHDIFFPLNYPKEFVVDYKLFWTEQYLLQAFLAFNSAFEVMWSSCYMHYYHPDSLADAIETYNKNNRTFASLWIRRISD